MYTYVPTVAALSLPAGTQTLQFSSLTEFFNGKNVRKKLLTQLTLTDRDHTVLNQDSKVTTCVHK